MKNIAKGIVFSNDIERILKGNNALGFSYQKKGISIPSASFLDSLRRDFKRDVSKIFDNGATIVSEEEMLESIINSISDVFGVYPHCLVG